MSRRSQLRSKKPTPHYMPDAGTTLFVRRRLDEHDPRGQDLENSLDRLCAQLTSVVDNHRLVLLDYEPVRPRERLIQAAVPRLRDLNDLGSGKGWNALFRAQGIDCRRPGQGFSYEDLRASFRRHI
jgi:hypothetical protein